MKLACYDCNLQAQDVNLNCTYKIQEESFDRFSHWGDLASVAVGTEENILAIPQHRIHYFKYRDTKIWDRDARIDQVFGSTLDSTQAFSLETVLEDIDQRYYIFLKNEFWMRN